MRKPITIILTILNYLAFLVVMSQVPINGCGDKIGANAILIFYTAVCAYYIFYTRDTEKVPTWQIIALLVLLVLLVALSYLLSFTP